MNEKKTTFPFLGNQDKVKTGKVKKLLKHIPMDKVIELSEWLVFSWETRTKIQIQDVELG